MEQYLAGGYQSVPESVTDARAKKAYESIRLPNTLPTLLFLGIDERLAPKGEDLHAPTGVPYFALDASAIGLDLASINGEWGDARASGAMMPAWEAGLFAFARPLIDWNFRHKFCQACGAQTYSLWGGWKRNCITSVEPVEGKTCFSTTGLHNFAYPRTDPVSIRRCLRQRLTAPRSSLWVSSTRPATRCFSVVRRLGPKVGISWPRHTH